MPNAREPNAPWADVDVSVWRRRDYSRHILDVWESPQTQVMPGSYNPVSLRYLRRNNNVTYRKALLWADNMDDTLSPVGHAKVGQSEYFHILLEGRALCARVWLDDKLRGSRVRLAGRCAML